MRKSGSDLDRIPYTTNFIFEPTEIPIDYNEVELSLEPCRRYIAGVSLLDSSNLTSTRPTNWFRFQTPYDPRAPPSNVKHQTIGRQIRISWEHSCQLANQQPSHYILKIFDTSVWNATEIVKEVKGLSYEYRMERGGRYTFSLLTPHANAVPVAWNVTTTRLRKPKNFNFTATDDANVFKFSWDPVEYRDEMYVF